MLLRTVTAATLGVALSISGAASLLAQEKTPIELRQATMKAVGESAKTIGGMLKGTTEFDAAAANAALLAMQEAIVGYGDKFPEGTEGTDANKSAAGPAIWTDRAGFDQVLAGFNTDIDAAVATSPQDKETLAAVFKEVGENCGTCHKTYRLKKE